MPHRRLATLLLPLALTLGCGNIFGPGEGDDVRLITALPRELTSDERALIGASNRFGARLLGDLATVTPDENVFISPVSASMALGMTMNGAAGSTYDEMRATLGFPAAMSPAAINASYRDLIGLLRGLDRRVDFRIANSIWYRDTFGSAIAPAFLTDARTFFDARVQGLDFAAPSAVTTINGWARDATNGRIPTVLESLSADAVMVLMNAIYFKGDWRQAFDRAATRELPFTPRTGATRNVPMMVRSDSVRAAVVDGRMVADLGYGGDAFSMTILLPRPGEDVDAMLAALGPEYFNALPEMAVGKGTVQLPKFRLTWEASLNQPLQRMGMPTAFAPGGADFSRLSASEGRNLFISLVKQNTFVDVNEVGTEAAAVTTVVLQLTSVTPRLDIIVDRPFVFALRERLTGTVLFLGRIVRL